MTSSGLFPGVPASVLCLFVETVCRWPFAQMPRNLSYPHYRGQRPNVLPVDGRPNLRREWYPLESAARRAAAAQALATDSQSIGPQ